MVHSTALNSSDNLPSYPPDNHRSSAYVYWRGGEPFLIARFNDPHALYKLIVWLTDGATEDKGESEAEVASSTFTECDISTSLHPARRRMSLSLAAVSLCLCLSLPSLCLRNLSCVSFLADRLSVGIVLSSVCLFVFMTLCVVAMRRILQHKCPMKWIGSVP